MARRPRKPRRSRFARPNASQAWQTERLPMEVLAGEAYGRRAGPAGTYDPIERETFIKRAVFDIWMGPWDKDIPASGGGDHFYAGALPNEDGRTWGEMSWTIAQGDPNYEFFKKELEVTFPLQDLWTYMSGVKEMAIGRKAQAALRAQYEEGGERKPEVAAAMKRMKLVNPVVYEIFAWHTGWKPPARGLPFDRVPAVMHKGKRVHPRELPKAEQAEYKKSQAGERGRKAWETMGYGVPRLAKLVRMPKAQVKQILTGVVPLFREDVGLFEEWSTPEVEWFLMDPERLDAKQQRSYERSVQAALRRESSGWLVLK